MRRFSEAEVDALVARMRGEKPALPERAKRARPAKSEEDEQIEVVSWARSLAHEIQALAKLFHVPNGGKRGKAEAGRLKAAGVVPGVPDLFLDEPVGEFHGLRIELKSTTGSPSREQKEWIAYYTERGFRASVQRGARLAILEICDYLGLPPERYAPGYVER